MIDLSPRRERELDDRAKSLSLTASGKKSFGAPVE